MIRRAEHLQYRAPAALLLIAVACAAAGAQPASPIAPLSETITVASAGSPDDFIVVMGGDQNDPDYRDYQDAYRLILSEQWGEAQKKLDSFVKSHPKSKYIDDASYWSAFALMHIDRRKAGDAYAAFIARFPESPYFDDAVADLTDLHAGPPVIVETMTEGNNTRISVRATSRSGRHDTTITVTGSPPGPRSKKIVVQHLESSGKQGSFSYRFRTQDAQVQALEHALTSMKLPRIYAPPAPVVDLEKCDAPTRLRIQALRALTQSKEDSGSFRLLGEVARDRSNPAVLRLTAMEELAEIPEGDPLPIFIEIAAKDTAEAIQSFAVDQISSLPFNKDRSVESLIDLFNAIPASKPERREQVFFSIAEVGNDRAVEFLEKIARNDQEDDLRNQAIYYLGNIGTPKARAALTAILRQK